MPIPTANHLRVCVLGRVRAWVGEREVELGPGRQRALFAVLATRGGQQVRRDELIEAMWGSAPPATAAGSVYTYLSGLRRSLEPDRARRGSTDLLTSGPSGYSLRLEPGALDADRFQRLRAEAAERLANGDTPGTVTRLDAALALWTGDAYAGLTGTFIELERDRLARQRLAIVEQRARLLLDQGDDGGPVRERVVLAGPAEPVPQASNRVPAERAPAVMPTAVARVLRDGLAGRPCFGRTNDVAYLRGLVRALAQGTGGAVWVDGEPGIGKTELLTLAFADAVDAGCQLAWSAADELGQRVPLQVLSRALGLETTSHNSRLAALAAELHGTGGDFDDGLSTPVDRILAYVRSVCAVAPLVLIIDDMHWADPATVAVWDRLVSATTRLPLLLVAAARPEPHFPELDDLRGSIQARQRRPLGLRPLAAADLEQLIATMVGAPIGDHLRALATRADGNPLYAKEMVASSLRQGVVHAVGGVADIDAAVSVDPPESLLAAIRDTVDFLSADTQEVLRLAALLGTEFAVSDVVAVTGRSHVDLLTNLEEALAAKVVVDAGTDLAFRHPFLRQALNESVPEPLRAGLHRHAAEMLARSGSPAIRVAEQLAAESAVIDPWVVGWLADQHTEVVKRAPQIAGDLIRQALDTTIPLPHQRETLLIALVRVRFQSDQYQVDEAAQAMELASDANDRADMRQILATMRIRSGDREGAIALLQDSIDDPAVPSFWRTRHQVLLAQFRRGDLDDLDRAERDAERIIGEAMADNQPFAAACAHQTIWLTSSIRRDHERALRHVDSALDLIRDDPDVVAIYFDLLDNKMFSLQNLDRLDEAQHTLREAALFVARHRVPAALHVATAVQCFWLGRWDEAMAEVGGLIEDAPGITFHVNREPRAMTMLLHGVAALVALHRDSRKLVIGHLDAADALPATDAERESCDFLLVARALLTEQEGRVEESLRLLEPLLTPDYAPMMLRHQWLPDAIQLALRAGRRDIAERAAAICAAEAAKEVLPARAYAAAARCRALVSGDPAPALEAAEHYRSVYRVPELAAALEDAAVLLAAAGRRAEAVAPAGAAIRLLTGLGATRDLHRMRAWLGQTGIEIRPDTDLSRVP
jgi:tetratricopeptide (TPR) repeat protein